MDFPFSSFTFREKGRRVGSRSELGYSALPVQGYPTVKGFYLLDPVLVVSGVIWLGLPHSSVIHILALT